jgi:nucleosome binding factor SPN SPT16 subunit
MAELVINKEKFIERLEKLQSDWLAHKSTVYGGADALCIPLGTAGDSIYSKSSAFHLSFFGNEELTDSVTLIVKNTFYFMSSTKKCNFVKQHLGESIKGFTLVYLERTKDEGMNREHFNKLMNVVRKGGGKKLGSLFKDKFNGAFIPQWMEFVEQSQIEQVEIAPALGLFFSLKDETEVVSSLLFS